VTLRQHGHWIEYLARFGYGARGVVYLVIGVLIVIGAGVGEGGSATRDAVRTLREQPFGTFILWLLVIGLAGYVAWRLVQAIFDTDDHGTSIKGLGVRAGLLASAVTYGALGQYTLSLLGVFGNAGSSGGSGGGAARWLESFVADRWVALILCLVFLAVAIAHFVKAIKRKYADHFQASEEAMAWIHPISITGLCARGGVFVILALLTFYRFLTAGGGADDPPGLSDALAFIAGLPAGPLLLTAMGLGLIAFALYSLIEARWRRINWQDA
jgi:hypothetical protein